jgi:hypothetical protein
VDGALSPAERHHVEAHLATCSVCRAETVHVGRLVRARERRKRLFVVVPVAAAAAAAGILLLTSSPSEPSPLTGRVFRDAGDGAQRLEVVAPIDDSTVVSDSLRFVWRSAGTDVQYALAVTDSNGGPIMSETTADTTLVFPVVPNLAAGQTYFWFVDALFNDGESATSGIHRFIIPP